MADLEVNIGELAIGSDPATLIASAIGSCLVVTLYDPKRKIGALAHAMLPSSNSHERMGEGHGPRGDGRDPKFVDEAIEEMLARLKALGTIKEDLQAKLIGGANMFPGVGLDIGEKNIARTKATLEHQDIPFIGEVGGTQGRSVEFSVATGVVTVKSKF